MLRPGTDVILRNIILLATCQMISASGSIVLVTLGGIVGTALSSNKALATLPVSMMVVSVAASAIPASMLMRRIGRKAGFALAALAASGAWLIAARALWTESFAWFTVAGAVYGINMAFTQQYRYAAAESVAPRYVGRAISLTLLGAIGGAVVGSELVTRGADWLPDVPFAGTVLALAGLHVLQALLFVLLGPLRGEGATVASGNGRPLGTLLRQPLLLVAVLGGTAAYGIMSLIMTATPISMHVSDGYSLQETSAVIRSHVIAMYLPSLVSGLLIDRLGTVRLMATGAMALAAACLVGLQGQSILHYWSALVLLGVGWNFLYVGGTTMLTLTYTLAERFRVQAMNDFTVFGTAAVGSLLAATVVHLYGWLTLVLVPLPLLAVTLTGLYLVRRDPLIRKSAPQTA